MSLKVVLATVYQQNGINKPVVSYLVSSSNRESHECIVIYYMKGKIQNDSMTEEKTSRDN